MAGKRIAQMAQTNIVAVHIFTQKTRHAQFTAKKSDNYNFSRFFGNTANLVYYSSLRFLHAPSTNTYTSSPGAKSLLCQTVHL